MSRRRRLKARPRPQDATTPDGHPRDRHVGSRLEYEKRPDGTIAISGL